MVLGSNMTGVSEGNQSPSGASEHGNNRWSASDVQVAPHLAISTCLVPVEVGFNSARGVYLVFYKGGLGVGREQELDINLWLLICKEVIFHH